MKGTLQIALCYSLSALTWFTENWAEATSLFFAGITTIFIVINYYKKGNLLDSETKVNEAEFRKLEVETLLRKKELKGGEDDLDTN